MVHCIGRRYAPQEVDDHVVAAGRGGGQASVDGLVIREVDNCVGPAVSSLSAGGADDPARAQDPSGLHGQLARRAAGPQDQHRLTRLQVSAVLQRHPADDPGHPQGGGQARVNAGRNREPGRIRDRHQLGQRAVRSGRAGQIAARAVTELHDRLVTSDVRGLEAAKRELVVHDQDIERIQGRRDQGAYRQALAGPRIGELVKGWRGAGSVNYCCSHWRASYGAGWPTWPGWRTAW